MYSHMYVRSYMFLNVNLKITDANIIFRMFEVRWMAVVYLKIGVEKYWRKNAPK